MRLILGKTKEALKAFAPEEKLEYRINRAEERLLNDERVVGVGVKRIALAAPYGRLALPTRFRTIDGIKVNGAVRELANGYWEFLPGKYDAQDFCTDEVRDLGDGWAVLNDLPTGGNLHVAGTTSEIVTVYGLDSNGLSITLTFTGAATHANPFASIERVHKEQGSVSATLTHIDVDAVVTLLAVLDKTEEESYYRRYMVGNIQDCATNVVTALARLRHIEFTSDNDVLIISNLSALENALTALQYEAEVDFPTANQFWSVAIGILNQDASNAAGKSELPNIRIVHVGGSPRMTSFH